MLTMDLQTFTPPTLASPAVVELRLSQQAGSVVSVQSHGYHYDIRGNTLLDAAALRSLAASATKPTELVASLYRTYREAGYLLVAVRAQEQAGQRVEVNVIEGQITQVKASAELQRFYTGVEFDPEVTENALIRRNIMAQAYAQRSGLEFAAGLKPAPQPGGTELDISSIPQPEFKPVQGQVTLGNYGSRYVSGMVLGEGLTVHPGHGLEINLGYLHGLPNSLKDSAGSRYDAANFGASVWTPWGLYGLSYARSAYRIGAAGAPLYPAGETTTWSLTGSQLVFASTASRVSLSQSLTHVENTQTAFAGFYTLTDQNYNFVNLGLQLSRNVSIGGLGGVINASVSGGLGVTGPRGTLTMTSPGAPTSRFHLWQATASWTQSLGRDWTASLNASGQWGLDTLPQNQQWVLGGFSNLSAWTPGILSGDGGYQLRAVAQTPSWTWGGWQVSAQGFAEQGAVTTHYNPPGSPGWRMLADVGVGLTFTAPWKTQLSLTAARPVASKNVPSATFDSQRAVYFVLQQPF
jgi:hemolysin activation/secretion protein